MSGVGYDLDHIDKVYKADKAARNNDEEAFTRAALENNNDWILTVNALPAERSKILEGFAESFGLPIENSFINGIIEAIADFLPEGLFDFVASAMHGGDASHTYVVANEMVDGKLVPREVLHAVGVDENGNHSSQGYLVPEAIDIEKLSTDPFYKDALANSEHAIPLLEGNKTEIYQAYATMLDTTQQCFDPNAPIKYGLDDDEKICNHATGENIRTINLIDEKMEKIEDIGAGMKDDLFDTKTNACELEGEDLFARVETLKGNVNQAKTDTLANAAKPKPEIAPDAAPAQEQQHAPAAPAGQ